MASRRRDTVARLCAVAAVVLLSVCVSVVALDPPPPYAPVNPGGPAPAYPNAKTITICASGCDYTQPRLAFPIAGGNRLAAGDTLEIRPGTYNDPIMSCMYIVFDDLNVVGVLDSNGNRPKLSGLCGGKAAVVTGAKRIKVSNLELAGVSCSDGNCAGVRHDAAGGEVTLTNLWIHDNQNGLLASAKDDVITIVDCLFENNGFDSSQGMAHNLYIGNSAAVYFRNSISRRAKLGGHEFKSRAYYTEIESSIIGSMDGVDSRNIDICDGGTLVLRNSIIQKGANSMNTDMINYAAENWNQAGTYVRKNAIFMSNNIGISDRSKSTFLLIMQNRNPSSHEIIGHTLVNLEKLYDGSTSLLVTGTLLKSTRAAAGYPAYPALPPVPEPGSAGVPPSDNSGPKAPTSPTAVLVTPPSPPVATNPGAPAPAYPNAKKVTVCASGCQYTSLYSAHQAAVAGDTIEVSGPGPYGCLSIEKDDITLAGVLDANGVRPKLTTTCGRKGVLVTIGKRITIKNLELYGAECSDGNCAGIRHDAAGGGLTLINVWSHDNQNGILASARDDIVTIQDCLFESNGFDDGRGMAHNLYMNKHAAVYFRNSISRLARLGGHELKSRAYYTEVESSYLVSLDGVDSRMVDAPEGGIVVIRNSVLASGARTQNQDMVGWAPENFDTRTHEFYAQNNIVISDRAGSPIFLQVYQARFPTKWQIANNKFVKIGTIISDGGAGQMKDVGSWVYLNREAANYGAYPYYPPLPTATPTGPATYSWKQSGFSACTVTCGGGTQTQTVTCVQDGTTTSVAESYCSGTKPATQQTCGTGACPATYSWKQGGFGACTATCGGGTQTQSVTCVRDGTTTVVADSNCSGTKPLTVQSCNMKACPATYSWKQSGFSACTVTCGGGMQTQTVTCVQDGTTTSVADTYCANSGAKPATQQTCSTQACSAPATFSWKQSGFGACTVTCGSGTQTQTVSCVRDGSTTAVADSFCSGTKPATQQSCNPGACPAYSWKQGGFGVCTQTCGGGTQTQSVTCVQDGTKTVADTLCTGTKPLTVQSCNIQACPVTYSWQQSGFSVCTVTCGGGTQTQTVTCVQDGTTKSVAETNCANSGTKPATQQTCNTQSCAAPVTFSWKQNGFGACTVTCGGGTQTQTVTCVRDSSTTMVADTNCDAASKPATQQSCNTQACSTPATFSWVAGGYTACTVTCGGGTQSQKVTCMQDGTKTAVDESNCAASTKPRTLLPCSTQSCPLPSDSSTGPSGPVKPLPVGPAQRLTIKVARDLTTDVAHSTYTSEFIVQTSSILGIPQRRVQVVSLKPGSTVVEFLILPPYSDETGESASVSAEEAAKLFIDDWVKEESTLRAQSSMADGEASQGLQANVVTQCGDMSYDCGRDASSVDGNGGGSKSVTSESWFIAVVVILVIAVVGVVSFGVFKYHSKKSASLKTLSTASMYGITTDSHSGGDVQMQSQSQSAPMPTGQVQPISQPAEVLFAARPPPPVPSNRPPPMPRREVPIGLA